MPDRNNHRLNAVIEQFINAYDGTAIGQDILNMYESGVGYASICDLMGIDHDDYLE